MKIDECLFFFIGSICFFFSTGGSNDSTGVWLNADLGYCLN